MEDTFEIAWENTAITALNRIYKYLQKQASQATAEHVRQSIVTKVEELRKFPTGHPLEPALRHRPEKFRFIKQWDYKVIFEVNEPENQVIILFIFHTRQNPKKILEAFK
jgi:plasmid stabilization system protein ParE